MFAFLQRKETVKQLWVILLFLPLATTCISWFVYQSILQGDSPAVIDLKKIFSLNWLLVLLMVIKVIPIWMLMYCSYKKQGTALLSFFVWAYPLFLANGFYRGLSLSFPSTGSFFSLKDPVFAKFAFLSAVFACIDLLIGLFWYLLCFSLRNANRELQFEKVSNNPDYLRAFSSLQDPSNIQELKKNYQWAKQCYPEVKYVFKCEYKEQKVR